ncbi:MAG: hypothetical protein RDV48_09750 [Candidatus Eremiobacteraeota bacterium]|nr:hypothetical protein [Candidatus Eremiobacteraeota bacterium]
MKKMMAFLVIMCLVVGTAFASTGYKVQSGNAATVDNAAVNGGSLYQGTVNVSGAMSGTYQYVYSSGLFINSAILQMMSADLGNPYTAALNCVAPSVGTELATTQSFVWNWGNFSWNASSNWTNLAWVAQNQVPGRTASWSGNDEWGNESTATITGNDDSAGTHSYTYDTTVAVSYDKDSGSHKLGSSSQMTTNSVHYSVYDTSGNKYVSPIVLDMTGSGKLEASKGEYLPHSSFDRSNMVLMDFFGNGFEIAMEWVGPNDGLLVTPKADGSIDASCLFGSNGGFENGYEKLSLYDRNNDNKISNDELKSLAVWQDKNQNGIADKGEVVSVKDVGITSLSLQTKNFMSSFERNGKTYKMWDWWPSAMELKKVSSK